MARLSRSARLHGRQADGRRRPRLGDKGLVVLIALANMFVCMSLDMYLPAIPSMAGQLGTTPDLVNLTMALFYAFLAVGTVVVGPLSEKYGRRKPLLVCIALYVVASLGCAWSCSVQALIVFRIGEALGGGGMVEISTALVKDCFPAERRGKVLAVANALSMIAPMAAPVAGSLLLVFFDWRAVFFVLAFWGALCWGLALFLEEPLGLAKRYRGSIPKALGRLFVVARNRSFTWLLLTTSLLLVPFMGYVAVSSYVYMDVFGVSAQGYGLLYAANTLFSVLAPLVYVRLSHRWSAARFMRLVTGGTLLSGVLLCLIGGASPFLFLVAVIPMTVAECLLRPVAVPLLLDQQEGDTGSASSLINFAYTLVGSAGMLIGSFPVFGYRGDLAALCVVLSVVPGCLLALLNRRLRLFR